MLVGIIPATSADLYTDTPKNMASEPPTTPNQWQFNFTPYGWLVGVNGKNPPQLTAKKLMRLTPQIPVDWAEQRKLLGFQPR